MRPLRWVSFFYKYLKQIKLSEENMALWGITDADESKPKWAVRGGVVDPSNIFATESGWTLRHYKNAAKTEYWDEVIVAVDGLVGEGGRGTDTLGNADITAVYFEETGYAGGATGSVVVIYNEQVDVTNGATLVVRNTTDSANITATAAAQTGHEPCQVYLYCCCIW